MQGLLAVANRGYSVVTMCGLLMVASLAAEHRRSGAWASVVVALECRLSSCGTWA